MMWPDRERGVKKKKLSDNLEDWQRPPTSREGGGGEVGGLSETWGHLPWTKANCKKNLDRGMRGLPNLPEWSKGDHLERWGWVTEKPMRGRSGIYLAVAKGVHSRPSHAGGPSRGRIAGSLVRRFAENAGCGRQKRPSAQVKTIRREKINKKKD